MDERDYYKHPDQWKYYGRCNVCRRKSYCRKPCTKNKEYCAIAIREYFRKTKLGRMAEAMEKTIAETGGGV